MEVSKTFDARGMICPMPILKTAKAIKEIDIGQILEVIADDEGAREDFPSWCRQTGHEFLGVEEDEEGNMKFYIKRTK